MYLFEFAVCTNINYSRISEIILFPVAINYSLDFSAEELGIKELLPAYLDPNLKPSDLVTGVCFASGASGYDPLTPKIAVYINIFEL